MRCNKCGEIIDKGYKFCPKCGGKIIEEQAPALKDHIIQKGPGKSNLTQKTFFWVGMLAILANVFLLLLSGFNVEKDFRFLPAFFVAIGLFGPISFIVKEEITKKEFSTAIISAIAGLFIAILSGILLIKGNHDLFSEFFDALSTKGYSLFYLLILISSFVISCKYMKIGIMATAFLIGLLTPLLFAAIIFIIISIVIFIVGLLSSGDNKNSSKN